MSIDVLTDGFVIGDNEEGYIGVNSDPLVMQVLYLSSTLPLHEQVPLTTLARTSDLSV